MKKSIIAIVMTIVIATIAYSYVDTMKNVFNNKHAEIEKIK